MKNWFFALTRWKQIAIIVLSLHCALLALLTIDHWANTPSFKRNKVTVNTVVINTPPQKPKVAETKPVPVKSQPPKKPPATKSAPPKSPPPQKSVLQEIASSLETIAFPVAKPPAKTEISVPIFYDPPPINTSEKLAVASIGEQIGAFLQETLQLPEFGEVKVLLSIDRFGHLLSLEVLEAKSAKNAEFLKNRLPQLQFPCLNEATSLTIVFSNAF